MTVPDVPTAEQTHPESPLNAKKAWIEMIHRYFAGTLVFFVLVITVLNLKNCKKRDSHPWLGLLLLGLVLLQALLGMGTVTLKLHPVVVMVHLLGGFATLGLLWWMFLQEGNLDPLDPLLMVRQAHHPERSRRTKGGRVEILIGLVILILQITLGGWVSANDAGLVCPDFPTCLGQWWPSGGSYHLVHVRIHMLHRGGALLTFLFLGWLGIKVFLIGKKTYLRFISALLLFFLILQMVFGISNVLLKLPVILALAHHIVAAWLLLVVLLLTRVFLPHVKLTRE